MIPISKNEIEKWRVEIDLAEKFREDNFGKFTTNSKEKSGENIDYFETGYGSDVYKDYNLEQGMCTFNVIYPIVRNIIPSLYWKNPKVTVIPNRRQDEVSAPFAAEIINHYYEKLNIKKVNQNVVFDAYVLGMGISKVGYTTQFGCDLPDEEEQKNREKRKTRTILEKLGLKKPKVEEVKKNVELNEYIITENPYVLWINPFEHLIDPRVTQFEEAKWVGQRVTKVLKEVKSNKNYVNTSNLEGTNPSEDIVRDVDAVEIDGFKTIDLYNIYYKTDKGVNLLVLASDDEFKALYHEENIYDLEAFQFDYLAFNKHNHKLYPVSDINIIKGLQDRINILVENILDQVDKYVPKLFVNVNDLTEQGKLALRNGDIGAIVDCNKSPREVVQEGSFTQLKADLAALIDKLLDIIMLITGLTKAQLMGMATAETATEAQIGQAGSNLRTSDKQDSVSDFSKNQAKKLWSVIRQFVDLEEIELITGEAGIDELTGMPRYNWLPQITPEIADSLRNGDYSFRIEVGSSEKPDLPILRKQVENMINVIAGKGVIELLQMQGYKLDLGEFFKKYAALFPDVFTDVSKFIQPIGQNTTGLVPPQQPQQGRTGQGVNPNQMRQPPPNTADIMSSIGGEKGGNIPLA